MAKKTVVLKGLDKVLKRLNQEVKAIEGRTMKGLILAVRQLRENMEDQSPLIPLDLGNLRASFFVVTKYGKEPMPKTGKFKGPRAGELSAEHSTEVSAASGQVMGKKDPIVVFGFTANYAVWVHEREGDINWNRLGSGPKFLETALLRDKNEMLTIIKDNVQIP